MTNMEYVARVASFYARNTVNCGTLSFDKTAGRFVILDRSFKNIFMPNDGLHCGDVYLVRFSPNAWRAAQCERDDDGTWVMCGTNITSENCDKIVPDILYVKNKRLTRFLNEYVDKNANFSTLSDDFVRDVLGCFEI